MGALPMPPPPKKRPMVLRPRAAVIPPERRAVNPQSSRFCREDCPGWAHSGGVCPGRPFPGATLMPLCCEEHRRQCRARRQAVA